ncbi:hypothetical protein [Flavobacterium sp. T12S277]|uniref:hypothetical protein n=1 Tax=Flavobacterium sp. T12S277 TaxID=3402752 RepID=UPI003AE339C1
MLKTNRIFFLSSIIALLLNLSVYAQTSGQFEFTLNSSTFPNNTPNQAVNIQFPDMPLWGWIEVSITSNYNDQLSTGKLTKRFEIGRNTSAQGGYFNQTTEIPVAFGNVANQWHIGDFQNNTTSIPIYHLVSTENMLTITIKGVMSLTQDLNLLKTETKISPIQTITFSGTRQYMSIMQDRVGIGTSAPDEKLTVKGKIHTQEVRVDMAGPLVPDYVFANDYQLKSLQEVEDYINKNKHLPEIPSAQEIEKNGLMLAEMNMNLLKKIEELTLYSIQQHKKIDQQSEEIESLKSLVLRVAKIEKELRQK